MKLELFCYSQNVEYYFSTMKFHARKCFLELSDGKSILDFPSVKTPQGFDIMSSNGVELGSYGFRYYTSDEGTLYLISYGTGLALPRFTMAQNVK